MSRRAEVFLALSLVLSGCGDDAGPKGEPMPAPIGAAPAEGAKPEAKPEAAKPAAPGNELSTKEALLAEIRNRKFKNEDFVRSETNRDPFESFLTKFGTAEVLKKQYEVLLDKYSIDELKLGMIVGPPTEASSNRPIAGARHVEARAMFIDPTGMGVSVVRGNHVSKSDAKVTRIEPDKGKVYIEIKEDLGSNKFRMVERVLEMHQGELNREAP